MPWIKRAKVRKPHECRRPWFTLWRKGRLWGCPDCLAVWAYVWPGKGSDRLGVWELQPDMIMHPTTRNVSAVQEKLEALDQGL